MSITRDAGGAGVGAGAPASAPASASGWARDVEDALRADAATVIARYPDARSALGPLLHLVQSVDSFVSPRGIALCAELLDLSRAEVSAVATFYSQYQRKPNGRYTVGVCTNTLCAVMGGDELYDTLSEHLGIENEETTPDGVITLERVECNAACDYAPVVMVNWEFFDDQTPESLRDVVDRLVAGEEVVADRGPVVQDFRHVSRVLAGFEDGLVDEGAEPGAATLAGLRLAHAHDWRAPEPDSADDSADDSSATASATTAGTGDVGQVQSSSERPAAVGEAEASGAGLKERTDGGPAHEDANATEHAAGEGTDEKGSDA